MPTKTITLSAVLLCLSCGGPAEQSAFQDSPGETTTETSSAGGFGGEAGSSTGGEDSGSTETTTGTSFVGTGGGENATSSASGMSAGGAGGTGGTDGASTSSVTTGGGSGGAPETAVSTGSTVSTTGGTGGAPQAEPAVTIVHPSDDEVILCDGVGSCEYKFLVCASLPELAAWVYRYGGQQYVSDVSKDPDCPASHPYPIRATRGIVDSGSTVEGDWSEPTIFHAKVVNDDTPEDVWSGAESVTIWVDADAPHLTFDAHFDVDGYGCGYSGTGPEYHISPLRVSVDSEHVAVAELTILNDGEVVSSAVAEVASGSVNFGNVVLQPGVNELIATGSTPTGNTGTTPPCTIAVLGN